MTTVMWTTLHYNYFTAEHYKVSKSEVFGKVILQPTIF